MRLSVFVALCAVATVANAGTTTRPPPTGSTRPSPTGTGPTGSSPRSSPLSSPTGTRPSPTGSTRPSPTGTGPTGSTPRSSPTGTGSTRPSPTGSTRPAPTGSTRPSPTGTGPTGSSPRSSPLSSPTGTRPSPTGSTRPSPTGSTRPAPTGSTRPSPTGTGPTGSTPRSSPTGTGSTRPSPTGSTRPAPTGSTRPAPTGSTRPAPTGSTRPAPTGSTRPAPTGTARMSTTMPKQRTVSKNTLKLRIGKARNKVQDGICKMSQDDNIENDENRVELNICSILEVSATNQIIRHVNHNINATVLKRLAYSLGAGTSTTKGSKTGGGAMKVQEEKFDARLLNGANLNQTLEAYEEDGNVTLGSGEGAAVKQGDMKTSFNISNWAFCSTANNCPTGPVGARLNVTICVRSPGKPKSMAAAAKRAMNGTAEEKDLGGPKMVLSKKALCDSTWHTISVNWVSTPDPKINKLVISLPMFTSYCWYDPVVTTAAASGAGIVAFSLASLLLSLVSHFM